MLIVISQKPKIGISLRASKETIVGSEPFLKTSTKSSARSWSVLSTPGPAGGGPAIGDGTGSIILPGIAGGVGGAGFIRRRLKRAKAVGK
jgi:hypothetical protein